MIAKKIFGIIVLVAVLLLSGCLATVTEIVIQEDGSGTVSMTYRISKLITNLGNTPSGASIPIREERFRNGVDNIEGVSLDSFSRSDDTENFVVEAELSFDSLEGLISIFESLADQNVSVEAADGEQVFSYRLYEGLEEAADSQTVQMIESFYSGYAVELSLTAPGEIDSANRGDIDGNDARLSLRTADVLLSEEPVVWEVRW